MDEQPAFWRMNGRAVLDKTAREIGCSKAPLLAQAIEAWNAGSDNAKIVFARVGYSDNGKPALRIDIDRAVRTALGFRADDTISVVIGGDSWEQIAGRVAYDAGEAAASAVTTIDAADNDEIRALWAEKGIELPVTLDDVIASAQTEILGVVRLLCTSEVQWAEAKARVRKALKGVRSAADLDPE